MTDHIPTFKPGDRVRVMQTSEMEYEGLSNLRGVVREVIYGICSVKLSFESRNGPVPWTVLIRDVHLMKEHP